MSKKKLSRGWKTAIIIVSVLAALAVIGLVSANLIIKHYYNRMNHETVDLSDTNYQSDPPKVEETEDPNDTVATEYGEEDYTVSPDKTGKTTEAPTSPADSDPAESGKPGSETVEVTTTVNDPPKDPGFMNILVIGTDAIGNTLNGRSDAIIVVSINPEQKRIVLTSIVRDTLVHISYNNANNDYPNGLYDKINASHSLGGTALLIKTIKENFGIDIDRYVKAKYADFVKVFENVGGLDISLSKKEIEYVNDGLLNDPNLQEIYRACEAEGFKLTKSGQISTSLAGQRIHLNADALFIYSRARKIVYDKNDPNCAGTEIEKSADWGRTERQRLVISRTAEKVKGNILMVPGLLDKCLPLITTDLTLDECQYFANNALKYLSYDIVKYNLPFNNSKYFEYRAINKQGELLPAGASGTSVVYIKPENKDTMMTTWFSLIYD